MRHLRRFITRPFAAWRRDEHGGATMEFVIGLPLLFIVMVFVYEFASLFWAHHIATNNVRSAVRYLARAPLEEPYLTQAQNIAKTGDPADSTGFYDWMSGVTIALDESYSTFSNSDFRTSGQILRLEASVPYNFETLSLLNSFSGGSLANGITLSVVEEARHYGE